MTNFMDLVGKVEKSARDKTGLTQDALARRIGLAGKSSIQAAKKTKGAIGVEKALALAELAELSSEERDELIYQSLIEWLERHENGRWTLDVLREMEKLTPKGSRGVLRSKVVAIYRRMSREGSAPGS